MKTIDTKELITIENVIFELEQRLDLYGEDMDKECFDELTDTINTLKGITSKPDFVPEVKYVEVEVPTEKILNSDEIESRIRVAEKHGRECINPNFKYCVFSTGWKEELYLRDDIGKAMEKAAALSKTKGDFFSVYSIKKAKDDTYRTYTENTWANGHLLSEDHDEFLHYDFLSQMAKKIVKL